jgi:monovalent cation/hydrogen antiporter
VLGLELVVVLGVVLLACRTVAARTGLPGPVLQLGCGLAAGFVPALREVHLPAEVMLLVFLPALLYWESLNIGLRSVRQNLRLSALLATVLVAVTAAAAAVTAHALGMPWGPAWVLGAVLAPTDATAVAVLARALPARTVTTLRSESLVNDGTALVLYGVAVAATVEGVAVGPGGLAGRLALSFGGGLVAGLLTAWASNQVRRRTGDPLTQNLNSLVTPFVAYLLAETVHASGVVAVVVAGLVALRVVPRYSNAEARRQRDAFWSLATYVLNGSLFVLIGIEAQSAARALSGDHRDAVVTAAAVGAAVIGTRVLWFLVTPYVIRALDRREVQRARRVSTRGRLVYAAAGFRGAVSLAAALAVPLTLDSGEPFPQRDVLVFVTCGVIAASLATSFVLPGLVRWSGERPGGDGDEETAAAQVQMTRHALAELDALVAELGPVERAAERLRAEYGRRLVAQEGEDEEADRELRDYTELALAALSRERQALLRLRDEQRIDDEALADLQRRLDLHELKLRATTP